MEYSPYICRVSYKYILSMIAVSVLALGDKQAESYDENVNLSYTYIVS